jgi:hypothetical protein
MIVEYGIQPNCSELVIRLENYTEYQIKEELEHIGIKEYLIKNAYVEGGEQKEWDDDIGSRSFIETKIFKKEVLKAYNFFNYGDGKRSDEKNNKKILEENGINVIKDSIYLMDENNQEFDSLGSHMYLGRDPFMGGEENNTIWYNQHCQVQGFPLLKKISDFFEVEVEPHDGGSISSYDNWLNGEEEP